MWDRLKRSVAPTLPPVTLAEAKAHLRVDFDDDDTLIAQLVNAAAAAIDGPNGIGYCLMAQTWVGTLDGFPPRRISIPLAPFASLTSIDYVDTAGDPQTMDAADYRVVDGAAPAFVEPVFGGTWPSARAVSGAVTVTFVVGAATVAQVPDDLRHAVLLLVGNWYENRESTIVRHSVARLPDGVADILDRYAIGRIAA